MSGLSRQSLGRASRREWLGWFVALGVVTGGMVSVRDQLNEGHIALTYLLLVQGGSARGGRPLGLALALSAFLLFNWFFLPPYGTLVIRNSLDWMVLVAFLGTSIVAAQLLYRARAEADVARQRAEEVDRLAALGAETLTVGRAEDALTAIASVIRTTLALDECAVYTAQAAPPGVYLASRASSHDDAETTVDASGGPLVAWVAERGQHAVEQGDGTTSVSVDARRILSDTAVPPVRAMLRPLQVRGRTVGVLRIARQEGVRLTSAQLRVLDALAYYAALGVERVRLEAQARRAEVLHEANRAKDAVLASVSHDLRTPLTTIRGLAHEIAADGDERAEVIEEEADRLNAFVAKLLDLSRLTSGAAVADVQPNEAEDLLGAAAQQVTGLLKQRELRIQLHPGEPLLFGRFDFAQTLRALVNLIENAAKYSPPATAIDLSVRRNGAWLLFSVADLGPGVPAGERERIFEPFYRQTGVAPDAGGTGLGLSIARALAEAQGGHLAYSSREGGGSVFTLSVPAIDVRDEAGGGDQASP